MSKKKEKELTTNGEAEFLEKIECIAGLGITGDVKNELPFFIIEDLIKFRRMEIKEEAAA
jgi:hypothetical protein